ncbi:MAG: phosphatidylserine decarboxylase [Candidatus Tectomicrobia bacterium]|uniref:Phosphatidylserine decarboxylase proenzyme n=1 Tax=Tectimicrobiota bacterium TaxID=2528274 RepID=A0A932LYW2_UNCTE|nr:phosphatidylserine decarboxylase [Candidatus Tectomicrobia bacterium]
MKGRVVPIAPDAWRFLTPLGTAGAVFLAFGWTIPAGLAGLCFFFVLYFFRDPERQIPPGSDLLLSPADGTVSTVEKVRDAGSGSQENWRVGIFLSLFNVHVNRVPVQGKVISLHYRPGKFLPAYRQQAAVENEQNVIVIQGRQGPVVVKQVAGVLARRIVCWVRQDQDLEAGQRLGLIRFGSRVEVILPAWMSLNVAVGDRVKGGLSILARIPEDGHGLV